MRQPPTYTSWKITCHSSEEAQALQQWLSSRIDLDRVLTDTVRVTRNGAEQVQTVRHRLGDYFAAIRTLPDSQADPASFRLVFHRHPEAGRFWKDLMVNILQETETAPQTPSIEVESKGDMEPITATTGPFQRGETPMADSAQDLQELLANRPRESLDEKKGTQLDNKGYLMHKTDPAYKRAEAFFRGTEALCNFVDKNILPPLLHILSQTPFQQALFGTYYRMQLWMLALEKLDHPRHFQTVLNATRGIYELLIDLKLLQADPTQAQKFHDFVLIARFESAKSYVAALDADSSYKRPAKPEQRRAFIDDPINQAECARLRKLHWPSKKTLHHWTGMNMPERAKKFGDSEVRRYRDIYATLSWYVHSGSPGSPNVPESFVVTAFTWGHGMIHDLFSEATEIICQVEPLFKADPTLKDKFEEAKAATGLHLPPLPQ